MRTVRRGGTYFRVADPAWSDPLDGSFAQARGGRWHPPGSFAVVYLNRSEAVARANVYRKLQGQPYGPEDLDPASGPALVTAAVDEDRYVDAVTARGLRSVGLPESYPRTATGGIVGWDVCQPIGSAAFAAGAPGIACRSAAPGAPPDGEELAWFQRDRRLRALETRNFSDWFWPVRVSE